MICDAWISSVVSIRFFTLILGGQHELQDLDTKIKPTRKKMASKQLMSRTHLRVCGLNSGISPSAKVILGQIFKTPALLGTLMRPSLWWW